MDKPCVQFSISKLLSFALRDDPGLKNSMSFISDIQKKSLRRGEPQVARFKSLDKC